MQMAKNHAVPNMWKIYHDPNISHAFQNFVIAAGLDTGQHKGPSFHDGDFYKTLEAVAHLFPYLQKEEKIKWGNWMNASIKVIQKAQRADGYLYTKAAIDAKNFGVDSTFSNRLSFEAYNLGHLMTAACVYHRNTGDTVLLHIAKKATDFLYSFYKKASPTLARNAICPSHYMGTIDLYRTTGQQKYLELAKHLLSIKGAIEDGTDDNQDRIPFRKQTKVMGHAVRATYLYAGATDLYLETGDTSLLHQLKDLWVDLVQHKMYITGGCGSLYDGVSPDGTSYNPSEVQKIHQAFGRDYQLPNFTAHNETCANIGNFLWNWRMLLSTGNSAFADVMELVLYNSFLSGLSLNGDKFLYTNPLAWSNHLPFKQRWEKNRQPYIGFSNCCPPNAIRMLASIQQYAATQRENDLFIHLYGSNKIVTADQKDKAGNWSIEQNTAYPWSGNIQIKINSAPSGAAVLGLRIPAFSRDAFLEETTVTINGQKAKGIAIENGYVLLKRNWNRGDQVVLELKMPVQKMIAHPFAEELHNLVAIKRGPIVYCAEQVDQSNLSVFDITVSPRTHFEEKFINLAGWEILQLEAKINPETFSWDAKGMEALYQPLKRKDTAKPEGTSKNPTVFRMVPYFAWGNRLVEDMAVWLKLSLNEN